MSREEAIEFGNMWLQINEDCKDSSTYTFFQMAIKALENHDTFMKYAYSQGKQDALSQEPCERFEWDIDGNVYKITKAKDGKEICQQFCKDAISREDALKVASTECQEFRGIYGRIEDGIQKLPSVMQKSGKWIITYPHGEPIYECPHCHASNSSVFKNFCPNCGAKMVEPQESEDKE